jgi:histidine triad (HIT) family protein
MNHCIFCKIVRHENPASIVYEDEDVMVFHDIAPQAPFHLLIIPKTHLAKIEDATQDQQSLLGKMLFIAKQQAEQLGLNEKGYRLVINNGRQGGQAVYHLHIHLLGGRPMHWPPG